MKKALSWLEDNSVDYTFHDYKKQGLDQDVLKQALDEHGWEDVINRRGTTWRQLSEDTKNTMNNSNALKVAGENPSIVKRPLLLKGKKTYLGFKAEAYSGIFS